MKNIAKILCFVLSLVLVISVMCVSAFADGEATAVARIGETEYTTFAAALEAAGNGEAIELLCDVTEEIKSISNVYLYTAVEGGVTITSTYTEGYIDFDNVTLAAGMTLNLENVYTGESINNIWGNLNVGNAYFHAYNASTTVDGGKITVGGNAIIRGNDNPDAGLMVWGDNDDTTVEFDCAGYIGVYSGTFSAYYANIECGYLALNNAYDIDAGCATPANVYLYGSAINVVGTADDIDSLVLAGNVTVTLDGASAIKDVRDFKALDGANPALNIAEDSVIYAANVVVPATLQDTIKTDGTKVFHPVAKLGDNYFQTLKEAVNACAQGDNVITLVADCNEVVTIKQMAGVNVVIDGNGKTFGGTFKLHGNGRYNGAETLTFQNIKFYTENYTHDFITYAVKASNVHNLTVDNCSFEGVGEQNIVRCVVVRGANKVTVTNCTANNVFNLVQNVSGTKNITVDGCTINAQYGVNLGNGGGNHVVSNSTINATTGYAVNMANGNNGTTTLNTIKVEEGFIRVDNSSTTTDYVLTIEGEKNVIPEINLVGEGNVNIDIADDKALVVNQNGSMGLVDKVDTYFIGANGNWWIGDVDTGYIAVPNITIVDGYWVINGNATTIRAECVNGVSPTVSIEDDGFWYIGGVKTEFKAQAQNGVGIVKIEKNDALSHDNITAYTITFTDGKIKSFTFTVTNGIDGSQGAPGDKGPDGLPGPDGLQGAPGLDGRDGSDVLKVVAIVAGVGVLLALIVLGKRVFKRDPFKL